jgi:hypothetical protein
MGYVITQDCLDIRVKIKLLDGYDNFSRLIRLLMTI